MANDVAGTSNTQVAQGAPPVAAPAPLTNGAPPAVGTKKAPAAPKAPAEPKDSLREIVETIVFVVVLVLLLKSFVAEAFVIPTGSMAETLWGYQKDVTCPQCKHSFPVNCSDEVEHGRKVDGADCPNCRFRIEPLHEEPKTGDRVLVAKFLWDSKLRDVERWDVVVFKFPEEPQRQRTPKNYIKRLLGLFNETIGILYGNLYVAESIEYPEPLEEERHLPLRRQTHRNDPRAVELLREGSPVFKILRKPPRVMLAMRRLVYDNDHQAADLKTLLPPRWAPEQDDPAKADADPRTVYVRNRERGETEKAWVAAGPTGFRHAARQGDLAWLRYRHLVSPTPRPTVPDLQKAPELIRDDMGYNMGLPGRFVAHRGDYVSDLMLEFDVTLEQPVGDLVLELSAGVDRFLASWQLATGTCTLSRLDKDGKRHELDKKETALRKAGTYRLRFANFDERLTVWVDGQLPFGDGVPYEPAREPAEGGKLRLVHGPVDKNDLEPASIGVRGTALTVSKLMLYRDSYYTNPVTEGPLTMYVQPGHYLCLGDNSPYSSDSRTWDHEDQQNMRGGLVPERLMLGRALAVYYPFYFPYWPLNNPVNRVGAIR